MIKTTQNDKKGSRPRDFKADANDGGRPPADDLHAVAEAAVEDWHGEECDDAAEEDEHLKKGGKISQKTYTDWCNTYTLEIKVWQLLVIAFR